MQVCEVSKGCHAGYVMSAQVTTVNKLNSVAVPGVGVSIDINV